MELKNNQRNVFWQTKEAAIKALVELDDQGGKDQLFIVKYILMYSEKFEITYTTMYKLGCRTLYLYSIFEII